MATAPQDDLTLSEVDKAATATAVLSLNKAGASLINHPHNSNNCGPTFSPTKTAFPRSGPGEMSFVPAPAAEANSKIGGTSDPAATILHSVDSKSLTTAVLPDSKDVPVLMETMYKGAADTLPSPKPDAMTANSTQVVHDLNHNVAEPLGTAGSTSAAVAATLQPTSAAPIPLTPVPDRILEHVADSLTASVLSDAMQNVYTEVVATGVATEKGVENSTDRATNVISTSSSILGCAINGASKDPVVEKKADPVVEKKADPVVEKKVEPVVEKTADPVVEKKAEPVVEKKVEPVVEKKADPVVEKKADPVVEKKADPVVEKKADPVVEKKVEPVVEKTADPVVEKKADPVVEKKVDPVVEKKVEPVVEKKVEPVVEKKVEPVVEKKADPVVEKKVEPVVEKKADPVVEKKVDPVVEKKVEPVVEKKVDPVVEKKVEPVVEKKADPVVEKKVDPVVEKKVDPVVEKKADPVVEKKAEPVVEKKVEPVVEKKADPVVEKKVDPVVEKKVEPVVEKKVDPVVEKKADPVVEKKVDPVVEKKVDPVVEKKVDPVVEKKVDPVVEKKADPVVEKKVDPVVEKKADPVVEKKADPVVEKKADPVVEKKAEPVVEKKVEPVVEKKAEPNHVPSLETSKKFDENSSMEQTLTPHSTSTSEVPLDIVADRPRHSSVYRETPQTATPVLASPAARSIEQGPPVPTSSVTASVRATNPILDELLHSLALINANDPIMVVMDIKDCASFTHEHAVVLGEALKTNTHLRTIFMSNSRVINQSAVEIARGLAHNTGVESVDLSGNNIGPVGMRALAEMLESNSTLLELRLDHQKSITSTGTDAEQAFARALTKNNTLQKLNMSFRDVPSRNQVDRGISRNKESALTGHRIQSGLVPAIQKSRLRLLGRALDPGVENVYTWLRGGVLNGEADLDQRWLDGTVEHESMGTRHDN
ncbi:hypothetical protein BASA62_003831 [Batrachochytrium salamandrivorans]|nr:hypothetical protein BASA62_003831 [Batrachochytrium salamandrivorans]